MSCRSFVVAALAATGLLAGCSHQDVSRPALRAPSTRPLVQNQGAASSEGAAADAVASAASPSMASEVRRANNGLVTLVVGPSPQAVLRSFIAEWPATAAPAELVGIEDGPYINGKYCQAVYTTGPTKERYAFVVRYDDARQAWVAGDGSGPIGSFPVQQ